MGFCVLLLFIIAIQTFFLHYCYMHELITLYLVLGTPNSGRKEIVCDLIEGSSDSQSSQNIILINKKESPVSKKFICEKLSALFNTHILEWEFLDKHLQIPHFEASGNDKIFLILSGQDDLIDQIESFKHYLANHPQYFLARILSVIDCQLAYQDPENLPWFEAVIYFSDNVFLTHRTVPEKWINEFIKSFEKQHYPCVFEKVKDYRVANPDFVLSSEARRMTHLFDNLDAIDTLEIDEDALPDEPFELKVKEDPYLERDPEGNRIIKLPSITSKETK